MCGIYYDEEVKIYFSVHWYHIILQENGLCKAGDGEKMNLEGYNNYGGERYYTLNQYLRNRFGQKVYKLALDGGMTCPNRDGTIGYGGCIFCSQGGSGEFAVGRSCSAGNFKALKEAIPRRTVTDQIEQAKQRIRKKTEASLFIAYFQSYTNTYAPVEYLRRIFTEAISHPQVAVLSIATRPDCLPPDVIQLLAELNCVKPVWVELGLQTVHEHTAEYIRRGYDLPCYENAVERLHAAGIEIITHVILGLPGESREDMLDTVRYLSQETRITEDSYEKFRYRTEGIKLQLLHVLKDADLAEEYQKGAFSVLSQEEYMDILFACLELLPPDMVVHRITGDGPKSLLIAPQWSANKKNVLNTIRREMKIRNIMQGAHFTQRQAHSPSLPYNPG